MTSMNILYFLQYTFIQRAYLAGIFIAVLCAVLGLFLVLRRLSLIGDGLSHVSFGAIALGLFLGIYPFYVAVPLALVGAYIIMKLTQKGNVYGDAAIGIVSSVGIAGGVLLASLSSGFNVDLFSYLFGNILAVSSQEVYLSIALSVLVLAILFLFYNDLFSATFDEEYARITGVSVSRVNTILIFLTAITVVLAIKVVGIMLASSMLILPATTALQFAKGFREALVIASLSAIFSILFGITFSFFLNLPPGATVVMVNFVIFSLALLFSRLKA